MALTQRKVYVTQDGESWTAPVELVAYSCQGCGITFALPVGLHRRYNEQGASIRCPNPQCRWPSFFRTESDVAREKRLRESAEKRLEFQRYRTEHLERSRASIRGHLNRTKRRVAAGVCPCCNRTFQDLSRHMENKHPDYGKEPACD
jgi:hypothetical protein